MNHYIFKFFYIFVKWGKFGRKYFSTTIPSLECGEKISLRIFFAKFHEHLKIKFDILLNVRGDNKSKE